MKIAVGSDMKTYLTDFVVRELRQSGHTVEVFGALLESPAMWSKVALDVAEKVAKKEFDQAVLFCWTGTGISLAANKVKGIRAALCQDAQTAEGARKWNDANILCMSLRSTSEQVAKEMLDAWFATAEFGCGRCGLPAISGGSGVIIADYGVRIADWFTIS
ncbi:MAG: RpiB/LacA/LacB family sugar-phosphate isomerase [Lewinellaceae bacterium]|nr:RpiB/LacA/LacB family sugar-phosphate isomerase [Lewinellaceae bacterium]